MGKNEWGVLTVENFSTTGFSVKQAGEAEFPPGRAGYNTGMELRTYLGSIREPFNRRAVQPA
jgi:hypothetical protein